MVKKLLSAFVLFFLANQISAQITQTVRGKIVDNETNYQLIGAMIQVITKDTTQKYITYTDTLGEFSIPKVPIGKHELIVQAIGYDDKGVTIEVNSGRETIVNIALQEKFEAIEEVKIVSRKPNQTLNEMATISSQQFSVEETNRYPGSRSDPARMVSNFAGIQGADDSRNDIIVRGNSPLGIVWRMEGIDIPNPSHFATSGSSGGPVSALNNKVLANSDFFMSAFPAEYGNSISGIFDLKLRGGNNRIHEMSFQFGFLGTELMAEGPLSKKGNSSYLVVGRYSTLSMMQGIGIKIGTDAVPSYGDGAFTFKWRLKKGGQLTWFGMGGSSDIKILISEQKEYSTEAFGEGDRDQYFGTTMGLTALNYKKSLNEKTFLSVTGGVTYEKQRSNHNYLVRSLDTLFENGSERYEISVDSIYPMMGYRFSTIRGTTHFSINHKITRNHIIKAGINTEVQYMNMLDSALSLDETYFRIRYDFKGAALLAQPFVQYKYRITENMDFTAGIHAQYYSLSNSISPAEPRLGWKWRLPKQHIVSAGAGLHSQTQPIYNYTYSKIDISGNRYYENRNMDFTKSIHTAIAYEKYFKGNFNFKTEIYYQHLYNVPVEMTPSAFSIINQGSGFQRFFPDKLENTGTGKNYGIEFTAQKFFDKTFFFLVTVSLYDSKYKGSDGIERNTSYNGRFTTNLLAGKEFKLSEKQSISAGLKVTWAGGKRYGYVDRAASELQREIVYKDSMFNELQFKDYFRLDLKVNWKLNTTKLTHEIGLDLINILNTKNILSLAYAPDLADPSKEPVAFKYQLGFLPIFYYKIDFRVKQKGMIEQD